MSGYRFSAYVIRDREGVVGPLPGVPGLPGPRRDLRGGPGQPPRTSSASSSRTGSATTKRRRSTTGRVLSRR
ncbi:MAG: hypothetical protein M0C28_35480 [Candidatus Moduliflexus flocculans]|nr:hypothetical protein [Candidatus Moduliflexus flocculans]